MIKFIAGDGRRARLERSPRGEGAKDAGADGDKTSVKDMGDSAEDRQRGGRRWRSVGGERLGKRRKTQF